MVVLFWFYLSAFVVMLGAELNAELELQTKRDTTTGPERPMGERGAFVADHVADPPTDRRRSALGLAALCAIAPQPPVGGRGARGAVARGRGGTGRHAGFRFLWREPCEFESRRPHQASSRCNGTVTVPPGAGQGANRGESDAGYRRWRPRG